MAAASRFPPATFIEGRRARRVIVWTDQRKKQTELREQASLPRSDARHVFRPRHEDINHLLNHGPRSCTGGTGGSGRQDTPSPATTFPEALGTSRRIAGATGRLEGDSSTRSERRTGLGRPLGPCDATNAAAPWRSSKRTRHTERKRRSRAAHQTASSTSCRRRTRRGGAPTSEERVGPGQSGVRCLFGIQQRSGGGLSLPI